MQTRKIQAGDLSIAVYESAGTGPAALFIHGNSSSGRTFSNQLEGKLGQTYRLVALDLPGHGDSSRATDPATTYNIPGYAGVVAEVAGQLNLAEAVIIGWSLGGHVALESAKLLPGVKGFVIYGTPPVGFPPAMDKAFLPHPAMASIFKEELGQQEISDWGAACLKPGSVAAAEFFEDVGRTDGRTRANLAASVGEGRYEDEVKIVENLTRPLAILHGNTNSSSACPTWKALIFPPSGGEKCRWSRVPAIPFTGSSPNSSMPLLKLSSGNRRRKADLFRAKKV